MFEFELLQQLIQDARIAPATARVNPRIRAILSGDKPKAALVLVVTERLLFFYGFVAQLLFKCLKPFQAFFKNLNFL